MNGYVYAIGPRSGQGPVKLGLTTGQPKDRLSSIQTGHPEKLKVLVAVQVYDCAMVEKLIHEYEPIKEKRLNGEWFNLQHKVAIEIVQGHAKTSNLMYEAFRCLAQMEERLEDLRVGCIE